MTKRLPVPLESDEAKTFVAWLRAKGYKFFHAPSETGSSPEARRRAIRMKQQGTVRGWPDYMIIKDYQLIAVELKRVRGSVVSPEQLEWLHVLAGCGVQCAVAHGAKEAIEFVESVKTDRTIYIPSPPPFVADDGTEF